MNIWLSKKEVHDAHTHPNKDNLIEYIDSIETIISTLSTIINVTTSAKIFSYCNICFSFGI